MTHHLLEPEPAGDPGDGAEWTEDDHGRRVQADPLRCEFVVWLGDDLITVNPDHLVTGKLADALRASDLTGFELREAIITKSDQFLSHFDFPERWERLVPTGSIDDGDDFATDFDLYVSERALALLNDHGLAEAHLDAGDDTPEAARFERRQQELRAERLAYAEAKAKEGEDADAQEGARIEALVRDGQQHELVRPTMRSNKTYEVSGDITMAVAALGAHIEDEAALAVLRLADGPVIAEDVGRNRMTYSSANKSLEVLAHKGVVTKVQFTLIPTRHAPDASYPRMGQLIDGCDPLTHEAARERLGEPKRTDSAEMGQSYFEEYTLSRKRVLMYWGTQTHEPRVVVVGRDN